jgi:hypothetical protein
VDNLHLERSPEGRYSAPVSLQFEVADSAVAVGHDLEEIPGGYRIVEADGPVYRRVGPWAEKDVAWFYSPTAGTRATLILYTLLETRDEP